MAGNFQGLSEARQPVMIGKCAHLETSRVSGTTSSCGSGARVCQADQHQGKAPGRKPWLLRTQTRLFAKCLDQSGMCSL